MENEVEVKVVPQEGEMPTVEEPKVEDTIGKPEPIRAEAERVEIQQWVMQVFIQPGTKTSVVLELALVGLLKPILEPIMILMSWALKRPVSLFGHKTTTKRMPTPKQQSEHAGEPAKK